MDAARARWSRPGSPSPPELSATDRLAAPDDAKSAVPPSTSTSRSSSASSKDQPVDANDEPGDGRASTSYTHAHTLPTAGTSRGRPSLRASWRTGSTSGSATPQTRYGSFPPSDDRHSLEHALLDKLHVHKIYSSSLSSSDQSYHDRTMAQAAAAKRLRPKQPSRTQRFERSRERLLHSSQGDDVFDSDADLDSAGHSGDDEQSSMSTRQSAARNSSNRPHPLMTKYDELWGPAAADDSPGDAYGNNDDSAHRAPRRQHDNDESAWKAAKRRGKMREQAVKQWGVQKMELMSAVWSRKGLTLIYTGVYLISALTSLEGNTTPTIEPYFLSMLGSHSMLSTVVIITSIAFAVGKPPFTKILDVFGRAEGVLLAAVLYSVGYLMTAAATNAPVYMVARAIASLGGQGLQLAQQIIVADTTTLTNRGLITSTISLPWLMTTWIGPPLGAWFQKHGEPGYRAAYVTFGILLPAVAGFLFCTLLAQWRKVRRVGMSRGYTPSTADFNPHATNDGTLTGDWVDKVDIVERAIGPGGIIDYDTQSARRSAYAFEAILNAERARRARLTTKGKVLECWRELDIIGLACLTIGCGLFLLPFTIATHTKKSWADPEVWILIVLGMAVLFCFGLYELRIASVPVLPPRLLRNQTIVAGSALGFFHFLSQFSYESFFTSFLQVARGHSPKDASYISQSYIFAACIAAILAGWSAKATQRYKWIGVVGVLVHVVGVWLMMKARDLDSTTFVLVLSQLIGGVGGGFTTIAAQIGCQSVVRHQDVAIATAIFLTITQIGGAVGGAGAGAVWSTLLPNRLASRLPPEVDHSDLIPKIMASLPFAMSFEPNTPIRNAINEAYYETQHVLNMMALLFLVPALVAVCLMENVHLAKDQDDVPEGVVVLGRASFLGQSVLSLVGLILY
ncbi:hypothetical protein OIV83_001103 [Microbotryomycetes sp. JL201]|nr:hypothetical protein OIV83_001103 [Microbotryomycetes sp. JL201]